MGTETNTNQIRNAVDLKAGDQVIGFDEFAGFGYGGGHHYRVVSVSKDTETWQGHEIVVGVKVRLDNGDVVECDENQSVQVIDPGDDGFEECDCCGTHVPVDTLQRERMMNCCEFCQIDESDFEDE